MSEELREKAKALTAPEHDVLPHLDKIREDDDLGDMGVHYIGSAMLEITELRAMLTALLSANEGMRKALGQILAVIIEMRDKHSSPNGDDYACGQWDMAQRLFGKIDKIVSETLSPALNSKLAPAGEGEANG